MIMLARRCEGFSSRRRRRRRPLLPPLPLLMLTLAAGIVAATVGVAGATSADAEDDVVYLFGTLPARPAGFGMEVPTSSRENGTRQELMNVVYPPLGSTVSLNRGVSHSRTVRALCEYTPEMADAAADAAAAAEAAADDTSLYPPYPDPPDLLGTVPANDAPVAFLVDIRGCSAQKQAQVAAKMRRELSDKVRYVILQGVSHDGPQLQRLQPIKDDGLEDTIGILYVSWRTGLEIRRYIKRRYEMWPEGLSPFFLDPGGGNRRWTLLTGIERSPGGRHGELPSSDESSSSGGGSVGLLFNFVVVLLAVAVLLCLRVLQLWWLGGGRVRIRRDDRSGGRIRGLEYVAPRPNWLSWDCLRLWSPGAHRGIGAALHPDEGKDQTLLTEEQFGSLPEIVYAADEDESETAATEAESSFSNEHPQHQEAHTRDNDPGEILPVAQSAAGPKTEANTVGGGAEEGGAEGKMTSEEVGVEGKIASLGEKKRACTDPPKAEPSVAEDENGAPAEKEGEQEEAKDVDKRDGHPDPRAAEEHAAASSATTSGSRTTCSICIEDFVPGEKLVLLPRCRHAFHRGCIHPWLTERQGCCPLCKTGVLADERDDDQDVDNGGEGGGESGGGRDDEAAEAGAEERQADGDVEMAIIGRRGEE